MHLMDNMPNRNKPNPNKLNPNHFITRAELPGKVRGIMTDVLYRKEVFDTFFGNPLFDARVRTLTESIVPGMISEALHKQLEVFAKGIKFDAVKEATALLENDYRMKAMIESSLHRTRLMVNDEIETGRTAIEAAVKSHINNLVTPSVWNPVMQKPLNEFKVECNNTLGVIMEFASTTSSKLIQDNENLTQETRETNIDMKNRMKKLEKNQYYVATGALIAGGLIGGLLVGMKK